MKNLVIMPVYNEIENLESLVREIRDLETHFDILIIDDNSPDGTGKIARDISQKDDSVKVLYRKKRLGLGTAYIAGFKFAIANKYDYIFEIDGDYSHSPKDLQKLLKEADNGIDLVIGSRYIEGAINKFSLGRFLLSKLSNIYAGYLLKINIKDITSGFRCYRRSMLEQIDLDSIKIRGFGFQIEITNKVFLKKFKIKEIPIIFSLRKHGKSKLSFFIIMEAFFNVVFVKLCNTKK